MLNKSNKLEKQYLKNITDEIIRYEKETGKNINNIAIYYDKKKDKTFCDFKNNTFTIKSLYTSYAKYDAIIYYLNKKLNIVNKERKYEQYFKQNNWNQFSKKQLIFEEDTLHLCVY